MPEIAIFTPPIISGFQFRFGEIRILAGEWIVFMCLALYFTVANIKNGIWDRKFKANTTTNLIFSLMAGGFVVVFEFFVIYKRYSDYLLVSFAAGIFTGIFTFILTFVMLEVCTKLYKKKRKQLEQEDETE